MSTRFALCRLKSRVSSLPPHDSHTSATVFINIEAINLDVGCDHFRERSERGMKAQRRRYQIDQRRFIANLAFAEQFCGRDMTTSAMRFDTAPVVDALKDVLAIFVDF